MSYLLTKLMRKRNNIWFQIKINIWVHTKNWIARSDLPESEILPGAYTFTLSSFLAFLFSLSYNIRCNSSLLYITVLRYKMLRKGIPFRDFISSSKMCVLLVCKIVVSCEAEVLLCYSLFGDCIGLRICIWVPSWKEVGFDSFMWQLS